MTLEHDRLTDAERRLRQLGHLERVYEEDIAALTERLKAARGTPAAEDMYDVREELRVALKQLQATIADLEVRYYTALRRANRP
jgi:DNA repair ATPase RecN